ncbi:MAG TPA: hypothetical protein PLV48_10765, partial [Rhodocyclaceae bacterium]|nr:hypothetical protein [Rhodocyclaceae bacterium]
QETARSRLARTPATLSHALGNRNLQHALPIPDADIDCAFGDAFGIMPTCLSGSPEFSQRLDAMRNPTPICRVLRLSDGKFSDSFRRQTLR